VQNPWQLQLEALGHYIREQRKLANLTLRELASLTDLSNAYISQLERGMHEPSVRVLRSLAHALNVSTATMLAHAGVVSGDDQPGPQLPSTEAAIRADSRLTPGEKEALLAVYRSYVAGR
jgi:transcriptional regulator with XRE-family HTH domain